MAFLKFPMKEVQALVDELNQVKSYRPTLDDMFNPELYQGGKVVDKDGNEEGSDAFVWPDSSQIARERIAPQLQVVKDHGLYLLNNADVAETPSQRGAVVYAQHFNPKTNPEGWYDRAEKVFGGDDGSISIPVAWAQLAIEKGCEFFTLKLSKTQIALKLDIQ